MASKCSLWCILIILCSAGLASAQEETSCYGPGSIATAVILTFIFTALLLAGGYFWWKKYRTKTDHLILETDPEKGKGEYAFDNPGFKDTSFQPNSKSLENTKLESNKAKWTHWSPLSALTTKSEKRKTLDDTALEGNEVKVIALRSHDFTGLGFNICGNMKEGIFIKDILHRGPAFESGKLNSGDRINSVTISFEHMVYEDALTILSYASPYEVIIEAKSGKLIHSSPGQGDQPSHPVYRSSSCTDLYHVEKSAKTRLFGEDIGGSLSSNYSSLQKSRSNMTTLERKESKSPRPNQPRKKQPQKHLTPEQLKIQLEERIMTDHQHNLRAKDKIQDIELATQKTENKFQKFGIRVLPLELQQKSPKSMEQNENNINIEKHLEIAPMSIDEVDLQEQAPTVKKRGKKIEGTLEKVEESFVRNNLNNSGIKRDKDGIPQELPTHMLNAALAARNNRKNYDDKKSTNEEDESKTPRRKGKAPSPPEELIEKSSYFDEIQLIGDSEIHKSKVNETEIFQLNAQPPNEEIKEYNSDSDVETDNQSSVNTIELNSSDITIHQTEAEERQNRKTVSTGDLTKFKITKSGTGHLERAQSLDITDSCLPVLTKKHKGEKFEDNFEIKSDEDLLKKVFLDQEPRLSLMLDGLNTFQRNRLKKSTEWGNLEDAILKLNQEDENIIRYEDSIVSDNARLSFSEKTPEFDAFVNKIYEIKRESGEFEKPTEIVSNIKPERKIKNQIWPNLVSKEEQSVNSHTDFFTENESYSEKCKINQPDLLNTNEKGIYENTDISPKVYEKRQQVPIADVINRVGSPKQQVQKIINNRINEPFENKINITHSRAESRQINPPLRLEMSAPEDANMLVQSEVISKVPDRINIQRVPEDVTIVIPPVEIEMENVPEPDMDLKEDWKISVADTIMNTSPPASLEIEALSTEDLGHTVSKQEESRSGATSRNGESHQKSSATVIKPEEVLSKIPLLNSMVKNQKEEALKKSILRANYTDETKTVVNYNTRPSQPNFLDVTQNFLYTEQLNCSQDVNKYSFKPYDTNISDDIKVSRHSYGSLERQTIPKSDDAKSEDSLKHVSSVNVTNISNGNSELHSLELSLNEGSELYTTALDNTIADKDLKTDSKVTISTPDMIKNVTLAEAINTVNNVSTIMMEIPKEQVEVTENSYSTITGLPKNESEQNYEDDFSKNNSTLTYITEIQVTPNNTSSNNSTKTNISEIEIIPEVPNKTRGRNLDTEFENYVKSFETKLEHFENNIHDFDKNIEEFIQEEPKSIIINEKVDEKELHKIQEIAEEQLKKLPEMRFTTSSYESKLPEKRQSQIELLRSNFERSPPKPNKLDITKSRIPIATTMKTPPTSPERRDSRNLDMENDKAILELMSSSVTSTPFTTSKNQIKLPNKNVTVTSIRSNSKIPSGLPTFSGSRPPIAPRKVEANDGNVVQVSTNGNVESSFKQWVFNPSNVTNVLVMESNQEK